MPAAGFAAGMDICIHGAIIKRDEMLHTNRDGCVALVFLCYMVEQIKASVRLSVTGLKAY
jgi:hypothetical protein